MMQSGPGIRQSRSAIAALVALSLLGWALIFWSAANMASPLVALTMPMDAGWTRAETLAVWLMWAVMMGAMMLPSAIPMILAHGRVAARRDPGTPSANWWFTAAYLSAWALFCVAATGLQWAFQRAGVLSHMLELRAPLAAGAILIAAGAFQLTPLKAACLHRCRTPMGFLLTHWHDGRGGAFRMGARHGWDCIRCCWALMLVLFVAGVMNLAAIAALAGIVTLEKLAPRGDLLARIGGAGLIVWGLWLLSVSVR